VIGHRGTWTAAIAGIALALAGCGGGHGGDLAGVERVFPGLDFPGITDIQSQPDASGHDRLFVVQKTGRIGVFRPGDASPTAASFLDISGMTDFSDAGEGGLLGLTFDPHYATNQFFYVHYTKASPRRVVISRFTDDDSRPVSLSSEAIVLSVEYPAGVTNHVAGGQAFGPADGYLYVTLGDGGGSYDEFDNAQDRTTLLGAILRLDVSTTATGGAAPNYSIPFGNPFESNASGYKEEIYAWGMRNPWRISIERLDATTQRIWVADVGQNEREEVDIVTAGGNYGWNCREGTLVVPASKQSSLCPSLGNTSFEFPVAEYSHALGNSITGGYVYRGARFPTLVGQYVYGDFGSGRVWSYNPATRLSREIADSALGITTFGVGADGELYIGDYGGGLYRLSGDQSLASIEPD